jgi:hypothetical protein
MAWLCPSGGRLEEGYLIVLHKINLLPCTISQQETGAGAQRLGLVPNDPLTRVCLTGYQLKLRRMTKTLGSCVASNPPALPRGIEIDPFDWDLIVTGRLNALLYGPRTVLETVVAELRPHLRAPLQVWAGHGDVEPALRNHLFGTLVLEQAATYSLAQQRALLEWHDTTARNVQVIATTDQQPFDLVKRGTFLEPLYYRLNIVHIDLSA